MSKLKKSPVDKDNPYDNSNIDSDTIFPSERELVVILKENVTLRSGRTRIASLAGKDVSQLSDLLSEERVNLRPLFGISEEKINMRASVLEKETGVSLPDLSVYYRVEAPEDRLDELAKKLGKLDVVETVYIKPGAEPPLALLYNIQPLQEEPPAHTPDYNPRQGYLDAAPGGIDARYAGTQPGGLGYNVRIIDIEGAWRFSHEDLTQNQGGVVGGTESTDIRWRNHGTAVVGEFGGDHSPFGITGICPDANVRAISIFGDTGSAAAIRAAADRLNPGDIILIELHRPGPRFNYQQRDDQNGYIAIEWWDDDFVAIRYATAKGIIVVEAAGNGAENLDDPLYNTRPSNFPTNWSNPFNRTNRDSGAIIVGAGAPPPGTHSRNHGPDRSRLDFSNFGRSIDAQGWGREVTTTGYGDLQGGTNEDEWYTDMFSGTSSASPIVVGALGIIQGILKYRARIPLDPSRAREILRTTGSAQQDATGRPSTQRIGTRPDLRQMISYVMGSVTWSLVSNTTGFGNTSSLPHFVGRFSRTDRDEIMFYYGGDGNWWLASLNSQGKFDWSLVSNTTGFGNITNNPKWIGDFNGNGKSDVLFYSPGDKNWWLASLNSQGKFDWSLVSNTTGFGNTSSLPHFVGRFSRTDRDEIMFYYGGDGNWWLASLNSQGKFDWSLVSNTTGFGNITNNPKWIGDFNGNGKSDVLFYSPGDKNWWLASLNSQGKFDWSLVSNTTGFGNITNNPKWIGDFNGNGKSDVLFYSPGDKNWWLASLNSQGKFDWSLVSNTTGFGNTSSLPHFVGRFSRTDRDEIMFYYGGDGNWWLASLNSQGKFDWSLVSNTTGFGNITNNPKWIGDFNGNGKSDVLFYSPGDKNWWLASY